MFNWLDMLRLLPEQASTYAADVDRVFYVIYYITFFCLFAGDVFAGIFRD